MSRLRSRAPPTGAGRCRPGTAARPAIGARPRARRPRRRARAGRAGRRGRSAGNASGSPSARIATYSTVQGPMPGSASRSRRARSRSAPASSSTRPSRSAAQTPRSVSLAALRHREHVVVGLGQRGGAWGRRASAIRRARPAARRGAARCAPRACGPPRPRSAARAPRARRSRVPSTQPGTRSPGRAATSGASSGSLASSGGDRDGIGVEVEQPAAARDGDAEVAHVARGAASTARSRRPAPARRSPCRAAAAACAGRRRAAVDLLDARDARACAKNANSASSSIGAR